MVCPTVTWPSPPSATRPRWRTARMVVAWISSPGVCLVIDVHQAPQVDVGVALRGREARVAEQLLDGTQIGAATEQMGGESVQERGRARLGRSTARDDVVREEPRHAAGGEAPAARVAEDGTGTHAAQAIGIGGERGEGGAPDRHHAFLSTLAEHAQRALALVN